MSPTPRVLPKRKHVPKIDVLIINAKLVEVGLNLVMFPTHYAGRSLEDEQ